MNISSAKRNHARAPPITNSNLEESNSRYDFNDVGLRIVVTGHPKNEINGEYEAAIGQKGKECVFFKQPNEEFGVYFKSGHWLLARSEHIGQSTAYAIIRSKENFVFNTEPTGWKVYDSATKEMVPCGSFDIVCG